MLREERAQNQYNAQNPKAENVKQGEEQRTRAIHFNNRHRLKIN